MRVFFALPLLALAACADRSGPVAAVGDAAESRAEITGSIGPVLGPDGYCQGAAPASADRIAPGISECELVRLKGREPTQVAIRPDAQGRREVEVLYAEGGGREFYRFTDNRLKRTER